MARRFPVGTQLWVFAMGEWAPAQVVDENGYSEIETIRETFPAECSTLVEFFDQENVWFVNPDDATTVQPLEFTSARAREARYAEALQLAQVIRDSKLDAAAPPPLARAPTLPARRPTEDGPNFTARDRQLIRTYLAQIGDDSEDVQMALRLMVEDGVDLERFMAERNVASAGASAQQHQHQQQQQSSQATASTAERSQSTTNTAAPAILGVRPREGGDHGQLHMPRRPQPDREPRSPVTAPVAFGQVPPTSSVPQAPTTTAADYDDEEEEESEECDGASAGGDEADEDDEMIMPDDMTAENRPMRPLRASLIASRLGLQGVTVVSPSIVSASSEAVAAVLALDPTLQPLYVAGMFSTDGLGGRVDVSLSVNDAPVRCDDAIKAALNAPPDKALRFPITASCLFDGSATESTPSQRRDIRVVLVPLATDARRAGASEPVFRAPAAWLEPFEFEIHARSPPVRVSWVVKVGTVSLVTPSNWEGKATGGHPWPEICTSRVIDAKDALPFGATSLPLLMYPENAAVVGMAAEDLWAATFAVAVVRVRPASTLVSVVPPWRPPTQTAQTSTNAAPDDDIEATGGTQRVTCRCPLTNARMKRPARGARCEHMECFDFEAWVTACSHRGVWKCAHCNQPVLFRDVRLDQTFASFLAARPQSDEALVEIAADGSRVFSVPTRLSREATQVE
jgi:ribosomal protein L12E/L44/L45/RPP1/RPP2